MLAVVLLRPLRKLYIWVAQHQYGARYPCKFANLWLCRFGAKPNLKTTSISVYMVVLAETDTTRDVINWRSTNLESKLEYFFDSINCFQIGSFGSVQNVSVHIIGDFTSFMSVLASNSNEVCCEVAWQNLWCGGWNFEGLDHFFSMTNCSTGWEEPVHVFRAFKWAGLVTFSNYMFLSNLIMLNTKCSDSTFTGWWGGLEWCIIT